MVRSLTLRKSILTAPVREYRKPAPRLFRPRKPVKPAAAKA